MAPQREWFEKDYYAVLGVPETATQKEITRAYRKLARDTHPDRNAGQEDRFKEVSAAYDVIGDPAKRKEYDEVRKLGPVGAGFGGPRSRPGGRGGFNGSFRVDDLGDLADLFGGVFGDRGRTRSGPPRGAGPQRGQDLEAELHLSFADAVHGVTTAVNITSEAPCATCQGSGARPGTTPVPCPVCAGRGVLDENQGLFSFSAPCTRCAGRGVVVESPCPTCNGSGVQTRQREVKVRIPAGVDDGQRIRLKGRGKPGRNGGPAGDLYVVVRTGSHPVFGRSGRDLTLTLPVTYPEAALGADITVPTLDGDPVTVRLPAGTRSGRTLRVKGRGVPSSSGAPPGDLLVTVEVAVPSKLSAAERKAVEQLAAATTESPRTHLES
ncbi:MAG TPA: molecular chaperone DnaJ [Acidimicrobiales bacterium]|nr:molecular chaperone DnaJ [Acidimicrobiales bacterium]